MIYWVGKMRSLDEVANQEIVDYVNDVDIGKINTGMQIFLFTFYSY